MVLAASSSFLENILKEADDQEDILILLPNIPGWVIKLLVKMVYGSFALDSWALGNELIVEAAEILGLVPQKFAHLNVMNISELTANFSDKVHLFLYLFLSTWHNYIGDYSGDRAYF